MASQSELRSSVPRDAVVRPLGRVVERPCARPACPAPARATLSFEYAARQALLEPLSDEARPQSYDLCLRHASRTQPPHGWQLRDRRPEDERHVELPPTAPADLGGDRTVAVLAAALRAVPDPVSEDVVRDPAPEVGVDAPMLVDDLVAELDLTGPPAAAHGEFVGAPRPALAARQRGTATRSGDRPAADW
jgi:hypothetical protein